MSAPSPFLVLSVAAAAMLASCASPDKVADTGEWIELQPGIMIDSARHLVAIDGSVAVDTHDPDTPHVYLEVVACTPDTREHEALVVTPITPSSLHAALLAAGFEPGSDATIDVRLEYDGRRDVPSSWITNAETGEAYPTDAYVFRGSRMVEFRGRPFYDADGTGVVISLATFPSAVIAPERTFSPEASIEAPVWIANAANMPARTTPVRIVLSRPDGVRN